MKRAIYAPEAEADIYAIARHIAEEGNLDAAYRFIDTIGGPALSDAPRNGPPPPRACPASPLVSGGTVCHLYRHENRGVEVARVLRGSRDIPSLF